MTVTEPCYLHASPNSAKGAECNSPAQRAGWAKLRSTERWKREMSRTRREYTRQTLWALLIYTAPSALRINWRLPTWAIAPGYYIWRLQRFETDRLLIYW